MAASEGSETRVGNPAEWMPKGVDSLVVFDDLRGSFGPLTDLRAAFELRAGLGTLLERIEAGCGRRADRMRAAVCLHYLSDLPVEEVAATLEVSPGTVKSNLHDARTRLRELLEEVSDV